MKIQNCKIENYQRGYTIIETMISISIFIVVITIGVGSLLNANLVHQKSQDMRSIIDSLSFIMEDMSRNLRTGYDYHCIDGTSGGSQGGTDPYSCASGGRGISFKSAPPSSQWIYYVGITSNGYGIFRSVGGETPIQLTPDEVDIDLVSGFTVLGAEPPPGDSRQPFVTIRLVGIITYQNVITPFSLQTSVSQRLIDI